MTENDDEAGRPQEDARWFYLPDVMLLEAKLLAQPQIEVYLDDRNDHLAMNGKGTLTLREIALVGCVYRKNIRQNRDDPGAVPQRAMEAFSQSSDLAKRRLCKMQIGAAVAVLGSVQFLTQTRAGSRKSGYCAAFRLLREEYWESPLEPTLNRNPH